MLANGFAAGVLEWVGDFFSDSTNSLIGTGLLFLMLVVWLVMQTVEWKKAFRTKREGDISIEAAQLEVQQAILERLKDSSISQEERSVLLQQLSRPGRN